jgi:hypothetical protein
MSLTDIHSRTSKLCVYIYGRDGRARAVLVGGGRFLILPARVEIVSNIRWITSKSVVGMHLQPQTQTRAASQLCAFPIPCWLAVFIDTAVRFSPGWVRIRTHFPRHTKRHLEDPPTRAVSCVRSAIFESVDIKPLRFICESGCRRPRVYPATPFSKSNEWGTLQAAIAVSQEEVEKLFFPGVSRT